METQIYDIIIIGAGISGLSAAYGASRNCNSILVIDQMPSVGGSAVHSEIGTICGVLKNYSLPDFLVNGFPREFVEQLQKKSKSKVQSNRFELNFLPYNSEAFIETWNEFSANKSIDYLFNISVFHTEATETGVQYVDCKKNDETIRLIGKQFIDCSGNSIISRTAPISIISESKQNSAYSFVVKGVQSDSEAQVNLALMKALRKGVPEKLIDSRLLESYPIQGSLVDSELRLKITLQADDSLLTGTQLSEELVDYLSSIDGIFNGISIKRKSSKIGVRSSICSAGKKILKKEDILSGEQFSDWIAKGDWPIEIWKDGKTNLEHSKNKEFYQISAQHITSRYFDNLYFGGKIISADEEAIASARVQGICIQTGYACGLLAAEKLKNIPEMESIKRLQDELTNG